MSQTIRILTGIFIIILSLWFILAIGFFDQERADYGAILFGVFFLVVGAFIVFNKKEDDIEQIKK